MKVTTFPHSPYHSAQSKFQLIFYLKPRFLSILPRFHTVFARFLSVMSRTPYSIILVEDLTNFWYGTLWLTSFLLKYIHCGKFGSFLLGKHIFQPHFSSNSCTCMYLNFTEWASIWTRGPEAMANLGMANNPHPTANLGCHHKMPTMEEGTRPTSKALLQEVYHHHQGHLQDHHLKEQGHQESHQGHHLELMGTGQTISSKDMEEGQLWMGHQVVHEGHHLDRASMGTHLAVQQGSQVGPHRWGLEQGMDHKACNKTGKIKTAIFVNLPRVQNETKAAIN